MNQITPDHVEKLLQHWADEHRRAAATYDAWQSNQIGGFVGQTVDRTREQGAHAILTRSARARVARRLMLKAMRDRGEKGTIPSWAGGDPARCKETRSAGAPKWPMDGVAESVDRWVIALWRWDPRAAMCLQAHYRLGMRTGEGARWVERVTEMRVGRHGYLAGLARGRLNIQRRAEQETQVTA
jgi:hypothetical protein